MKFFHMHMLKIWVNIEIFYWKLEHYPKAKLILHDSYLYFAGCSQRLRNTSGDYWRRRWESYIPNSFNLLHNMSKLTFFDICVDTDLLDLFECAWQICSMIQMLWIVIIIIIVKLSLYSLSYGFDYLYFNMIFSVINVHLRQPDIKKNNLTYIFKIYIIYWRHHCLKLLKFEVGGFFF